MGGMEVLMDLPLYRTTLRTMEPCIAIQISREQFEKWLMSDISAMKYEAKLMGEYLLEQGRLAREYMFLPGPERIAKLLIQKYDKYSEDGVLSIRSNRQTLANESGYGIKTVNRAVKSPADGGYMSKLIIHSGVSKHKKEFPKKRTCIQERCRCVLFVTLQHNP